MRRWSLLAAIGLAPFACSPLVDVEVGAGLGAACERDEQCQGTTCIEGLCTLGCGDDAGCPGGSTCARGTCQLPLRVGFLYPYDLEQDDIARSLDLGRAEAEASLEYVVSETRVGQRLSSDALATAEQLVASGVSVLVVSSTDYPEALATFASANPEVEVLALSSRATGEGLVSFDARTYQAYYLAGIAAARTTTTRRLGMVGSETSPPVVARVNAFALGARSVLGDDVTIELRWIGDWHDTEPPVGGETRERRETRELVEAGADVVAHTLDNNIPVATIVDLNEEGAGARAIGANLAGACEGLAPGSCVGTVHYRWGPLLASLLDGIHRQSPPGGTVLEGIRISDAESVLDFDVDRGTSGWQSLASELDDVRASLASDTGVGRVFEGPISSTGQCEEATGVSPCVAEGARLDDAGLSSMCWLVTGIVDSTGAPARVPSEDGCAADE